MKRLDFEIETLERRALLAGNVTASVVGNNLVLRGDNDGNLVKISSTSLEGTLVIAGVDDTMIDGEPEKVVENVVGSIRANLKNGDNAILLKREPGTAFRLRGGVTIKSGSGDDVAGLFGVTAGGRTTIRLGEGDNFVDFSNGLTRGLKVRTGAGDDLAYLHNSRHLGAFNIRTGDGNDVVKSSFNEFYVFANSIKVGRGNDLVDISNSQFFISRAPVVDGQSGNDGFYGSFTFATGNRNDNFEYDLGIGEINDAIESHRGSLIYSYLSSFDGMAERT